MLSKYLVVTVISGIAFLMFSGFDNNSIQKKIIRNKDFDLHFYVSLKKKKTLKDRNYHWYRSGEVHNSYAESGGELLHGTFIKYYKGNQLAEKGNFKFGLKVGKWKNWHQNGLLKEVIHWKNGFKSGRYKEYDSYGKTITEGHFRKNKKAQIWVNHIKADTTWFRKGRAYKEHPRIVREREDSLNNKPSLLRRIFKKKDSTNQKNTDSFFKRIFEKKDSTHKKPSFFRRLFSNGKRNKNNHQS